MTVTELTLEQRAELRDLCRDFAEDSIVVGALSKLLEQVVTEIYEHKIRPLKTALAKAEEKTGCGVTVGPNMMVYGEMDAIVRVQQWILLDSNHPVERESSNRRLMRRMLALEERLSKYEPV